MFFRARPLGTLFLTALLACAITTIAAASSRTHHRHHSIHAASRHHRRFRNPPGGCYARAAIVVDPATNQVLFDKNADSSVPIDDA